MSRAIEQLYLEHVVIKSVIALREEVIQLADSSPEKFKDVILRLIDFFRNYDDKYHHYKEEKLLFPLMCEKNEMLKDGIIEEMLENHRDFRDLVKLIEESAAAGNNPDCISSLKKYTEMLHDHIAVEDDELFQIAESLFDDDELEKLYFDFEDIDRELGLDSKIKYENVSSDISHI